MVTWKQLVASCKYNSENPTLLNIGKFLSTPNCHLHGFCRLASDVCVGRLNIVLLFAFSLFISSLHLTTTPDVVPREKSACGVEHALAGSLKV